MRIGNRQFKEPFSDFVVLPRPDGNVVFKAVATQSFDEFNKVCIKPKPPFKQGRDGVRVEDTSSPAYLQMLGDYSDKLSDWQFLTCLSHTPDLAWDTVDMAKPSTWGNWQKELKDAFFSNREINLLINLVQKVNGLDDQALADARAGFLIELAKANGQYDSQKDVPPLTPSGEPANASELDLTASGPIGTTIPTG